MNKEDKIRQICLSILDQKANAYAPYIYYEHEEIAISAAQELAKQILDVLDECEKTN
jgi:hypothetical protein